MMTWNDERVELLKKLWAEGLSASQIAVRLGEVTRNAVIGKCHRLGLSGRIALTPEQAKARKSAASKLGGKAGFKKTAALGREIRSTRAQLERDGRGRFSAMARAAAKARELPAPAPKPVALLTVPARVIEPEEPILPSGVALLDLKESMCRYPHGDPMEADFHFCGARKADGSPYCEAHTRVCFVPVSRKPKQPKPKNVRLPAFYDNKLFIAAE